MISLGLFFLMFVIPLGLLKRPKQGICYDLLLRFLKQIQRISINAFGPKKIGLVSKGQGWLLEGSWLVRLVVH